MIRRFKDDYELIHTVDDKGRQKTRAEYRGAYYQISLAEPELRRLRWGSLLLLCGITALHTLGGFVNNHGMQQFYIVIPYAICFFSIYFLGESILRMPKQKRDYRRDEVELSFKQAKTASKILLVLLALISLGELLFLLFFAAPEARLTEVFFLSAEAISTFLAYFLMRSNSALNIEAKAETNN